MAAQKLNNVTKMLKLLLIILLKVYKCTFYNNNTCRFIVVICFVYMGDNTNCLFSFVFNKTENEMYIIFLSFYSEN